MHVLIDFLLQREAPRPWAEGAKIPWNDPAFSERMLREHLSQSHDRASRRSAIIEEQITWIHETVLAGRPGRVLDLGCGPGLYTAGLAGRGHRCTGIDYSPSSIEYARALAAREGLSCEYQHADLRRADLAGPYEAALMIFGELHTFPPPVALEVLARARRTLGAEGRLILEVHPASFVRALAAQPPTWQALPRGLFAAEPHLVLRECRWHPEESAAVESFFVFTESEGARVFGSTTQAYERAEWTALLANAGLEEVAEHACLTGREVPVDDGLFVIIARPTR